MLLIPYEIETLQQERPWMNWLVVALSSLMSLGWLLGLLSDESVQPLVLDGWHLTGLLGHVLLHADLVHWIGNMVFLWVFGNAICTNIGNFPYLIVFILCTLAAATLHNLIDGTPAIGASGAINGVVGMALALYPLNRIHVFWLIIIRSGSFECPAWAMILFWFLFDIWGVVSGEGMTAYWAHIGGLLGGVLIGIAGLHLGWLQLTEYDNRSLLQILKGERDEAF